MLTPASLPRVQRAIAELGFDGWLLYDFRGCNPIAQSMLGLEGLQTRRIFGFLPVEGTPTALVHRIEPGPLRRWPNEWRKHEYSGWRELEGLVTELVRDKRVAMEYSPGDAVTVLDRVPAGVLDLIRAHARDVLSSGELVSLFYAVLDAQQIAAHCRAAEAIAMIARQAMQLAGDRARSTQPATEYEIFQWIHNAFARAGLTTDHGPSVSVNANAADPHYEPTGALSEPITLGSTLLIDLFAHEAREGGVWADQCWMGTVGPPSDRVATLWTGVRDARDAAIDFLRAQTRTGAAPKGAAVDDIARGVLRQRGVADQFTHRTGHSIDARELHGAGPNLDNLETREERLLIPGVAFSIEPGVYFPGEVGLRSEVNAVIGGGAGGELLITPNEYQRELIVV
ncbi:MAG TPA: M24 family metallopeptidase [Gemmatimonadaceae bacterium]|nr:M24 family metallopeptidase [Gemmatimonadaceae bacterium]